MADIDTRVLYLETPSVSAPPAAYTIGVRMKNVGIHNRATGGYVQVHRVSTGLLEKTYSMVSAVIEPDEEKQAFSTETWDLREEDPGTEFIVSGMITSDGDTDPSNDILNPTTVTVVDEPPPPPPPVAAHVTMHEDGGSDELNLEGLHGTPADPQEFAPHAAKHMTGGDDEMDVSGLDGALLDPQIPTDHGNERHVEDFALVSELTGHLNDATPHNDALLAPVLNTPAEGPNKGAASTLAASDHRHGGEGGLSYSRFAGPLANPGGNIGNLFIYEGCLTGQQWATVRTTGMLQVDAPAGPADTIDLILYAGAHAGALVQRGILSCPIPGGTNAQYARFSFLSIFSDVDFWTAGEAIGLAAPAEFHAHQIPNTTPAIDMSVELMLRVTVNIPGTATIQNVLWGMNLDSIELAL